MRLEHASVQRRCVVHWCIAPLNVVYLGAAGHYDDRDCDRRMTVMAAPMTAAPMTVPRILTVPRDRTEDSAAHGEISACRDVILAEM
jgi:hypothetical protein